MLTRFRQRLSASTVVLALLAVVTACVPSDPLSPFSLSVVDGVPTFAWCGERTQLRYIEFEYRTFSPDSDIATLAQGVGYFVLDHGTQFSVTEPPEGVVLEVDRDLPTEYGSMRLFVIAGASANDVSLITSFDVKDLAELEGGHWLQSSGEVSDSPCE